MKQVRKIHLTQRVDERKKIMLWRVVGFDVVFGKLVIENTLTGERSARYMSTGAGCSGGGVKVVEWGRDAAGKQIEVVKYEADYVDPPPRKEEDHSDSCLCHICRERMDVADMCRDDFGQPGD